MEEDDGQHTDESTDAEDILEEEVVEGHCDFATSTTIAPPLRLGRIQAINSSPEVYTPLENSEPAQACESFATRVGMIHPSDDDFSVGYSEPTMSQPTMKTTIRWNYIWRGTLQSGSPHYIQRNTTN